ncbi:hypothetical protein V6Z11_D11G118000 [Gossypium hirsutum]
MKGLVASDPDHLQDFCVADKTSRINGNGYPCKNAVNVTEVDFFFGGLANSAVINNLVGSVITTANVEKIPGLNTLGVSLARIDYQPDGLNPPHTHPRASKIIFVLDGELDVGFITTANKLISKSIKKKATFLSSVIAGFNSQFPGTQSIATTLFASTAPDHVLTKGLHIGTKGVEKMRNKLAPKKT